MNDVDDKFIGVFLFGLLLALLLLLMLPLDDFPRKCKELSLEKGYPNYSVAGNKCYGKTTTKAVLLKELK